MVWSLLNAVLIRVVCFAVCRKLLRQLRVNLRSLLEEISKESKYRQFIHPVVRLCSEPLCTRVLSQAAVG
jgi:hypothetical protein